MTYRIETLNGRGLPSNVDASGYDTYLAAAEMAEQEHDGDYSVESDGGVPLVPRGGKRPGAGRPPGTRTAEEPVRQVSTALRPSVLAQVDEAAERAGQSRAAWIAEAVRRRLRRR